MMHVESCTLGGCGDVLPRKFLKFACSEVASGSKKAL